MLTLSIIKVKTPFVNSVIRTAGDEPEKRRVSDLLPAAACCLQWRAPASHCAESETAWPGALRQPLLEVFPPALLGRLLVVPYYPLSDEMLGQIVRLQLKRIQRRLEENHSIISEFDDSVVEQIVQRCTEVESGGRMVDAILTNTLLPQMSQILLTASRSDEQYRRLHVTCEQGEFHCQFAA